MRLPSPFPSNVVARSLGCVAAIVLGTPRAHPAPLTWTGAGDGTTFSQPSNWSPAIAPSSTSDCIIPDGPLPITFTANANIRSLSTARNLSINNCFLIVLRAGLTISNNAVITVDNTAGCTPLIFQGGTQSISGAGRIAVSGVGNNGAVLTLTSNASVTITSGITLAYGPSSGGQATSFNIGSGCKLTNQGSIIVEHPGSQFTVEGNGVFINRGTLDVRAGKLVIRQLSEELGQLLLAPNAAASISGNLFNISTPLNLAGGADLTLDGAFTVAAPISVVDSTLRVSGTWSNLSDISSLRSAITLTGQWSNQGTLQTSDSPITVGGFSPDLGTHHFTGGTLTYTEVLPDGIVLTADASTSDIVLDSVVLNNASLHTLDGARFLFRSTPYHRTATTLTACTLNGEFSIDDCTLVRVRDGLTLESGTTVVLHTGCSNGGLTFDGPPQSLSGFGELVALGPNEFTDGTYYMLTVQTELILDSGITFRVPPAALSPGTRKIVVNTGRLINRGTIRMQAPGGDFAIVGTRFENQGIIEATAGQIRIYPWKSDNLKNNQLSGGIWRAINAPISFDQSTFDGIGSGADITLEGPLGSIPQLNSIAFNAGTLRLRTRIQSFAPKAPGLFSNSGTIELAADATLAVSGSAALTGAASLRVQVAGLNPDQIGRFTATGPLTLGGALKGSFQPPYSPAEADITAPIVQSPQVTGSFASYCFDDNPSGFGVVPVFDSGPPESLALQVSAAAGVPASIIHGPATTSSNPSVTFYVDAWPLSISYQWLREGEPLADGPTADGAIISGATTPELTIRNARPQDVAQYAVVVSTGCSSVASDAAWLRYCHGDFNSDLVVDDVDFMFFALNYSIMDCADHLMPRNCPGDFNADGFVDDADFQVFSSAYNTLMCPQLAICRCSMPAPEGPPCDVYRCD